MTTNPPKTDVAELDIMGYVLGDIEIVNMVYKKDGQVWNQT